MPEISIRTFTIKRVRKQYDDTERWVPIGTCIVNSDGTGTMYLNHQDEIWKLFEQKKGSPKES